MFNTAGPWTSVGLSHLEYPIRNVHCYTKLCCIELLGAHGSIVAGATQIYLNAYEDIRIADVRCIQMQLTLKYCSEACGKQLCLVFNERTAQLIYNIQ